MRSLASVPQKKQRNGSQLPPPDGRRLLRDGEQGVSVARSGPKGLGTVSYLAVDGEGGMGSEVNMKGDMRGLGAIRAASPVLRSLMGSVAKVMGRCLGAWTCHQSFDVIILSLDLMERKAVGTRRDQRPSEE